MAENRVTEEYDRTPRENRTAAERRTTAESRTTAENQAAPEIISPTPFDDVYRTLTSKITKRKDYNGFDLRGWGLFLPC